MVFTVWDAASGPKEDLVDARKHYGRTDLNLLVIFRAVARRKSVTLAAGDLALSQPAVSHALNRLRDVVKDPLFVRTGKGLALTPRAETLLSAVSPALAVIEEVVNSAEFDPLHDARTFTIGVSEYASRVLMPSIFTTLRREAPNCQLHAVSTSENSFEQLLSGKIDFLFYGDIVTDSRFDYQNLFMEHFVLVLSTNHPLLQRGRDAISLDDYLAYPHVRISIDESMKGPIDRALDDLERKRTISYSSVSFSAAVEAVEKSDILCALPSRLAAAHVRGGLTCVPMPLQVAPYPYRLVWDPHINADAAARWFRSRVLAEFQMKPETIAA